jgi:hypothetical protein
MDQPVCVWHFPLMDKSNEGDSALSSFDVKNKELIEALQKHSNSTGKKRDVLARELMRTFLKFTEFMSVPALEGSGVHPDLLNLAIDGVSEYVNGGSFDLFVGGQTTKNPNGRPNKKRRNDAIRLSVALNIDDGADVVAATTLTSEQLAIGEVDGLPVVTLTPGAIRSIWYAAPLVFTAPTLEQQEPKETVNLSNDKSCCCCNRSSLSRLAEFWERTKDQKQFHENLTGLKIDELDRIMHSLGLISKGAEPNEVFHFAKHEPTGKGIKE